jgi:hypothetical protein
MSDTLDIREVARVLGGDALHGNRALVPGPGHSRRDRSLSIRLAPDAPDGFMVHSHAGDDWRACRDYVKAALGIDSGGAASPRLVASPEPDDRERIAQASAIWMGAVEPQGTPVEAYLASRGLSLPSAVRWHPSCPFGKSTRTGCMVALVVDIETNEPRAIHRTSITTDGRKVEVGGYDRLSLGPIMGGAIKLSPDETVTAAVGIGEGMRRGLPGYADGGVVDLMGAERRAAQVRAAVAGKGGAGGGVTFVLEDHSSGKKSTTMNETTRPDGTREIRAVMNDAMADAINQRGGSTDRALSARGAVPRTRKLG